MSAETSQVIARKNCWLVVIYENKTWAEVNNTAIGGTLFPPLGIDMITLLQYNLDEFMC